MATIATIGLDLAKTVFQVHCVDGVGNVVIKRELRQSEVLKFFTKVPACLVGIEACGTAHYWGREISKPGRFSRKIVVTANAVLRDKKAYA